MASSSESQNNAPFADDLPDNFFTRLWTSIFIPGATPTLLLATNATFAALQALLFALLLATYSVHFFILSFLSAGLWWSINWFAREMAEAERKEEEAKRLRRRASGRDKETMDPCTDREQKAPVGEGQQGGGGEGMDSGDDTETETEGEDLKASRAASSTGFSELGRSESQDAPSQLLQTSSGLVSAGTTGAQVSLDPMVDDALKKRRSYGAGESEGISTDSEWEKVEGER